MNYFELLGLELDFYINQNKLKEAYLVQQSKYHPDKFVNADEASKNEALEKSILLNKAYDTLKSDVDRAGYLLELAGGKVNSDESFVDSPNMLFSVFEDIEQLESANSLVDLERLLKIASEDLRAYKSEFSLSYKFYNLIEAGIAYKKMIYKSKFILNIKSNMNKLAAVV